VPDILRLQLGEAKDLLAAVQDTRVEQQVVATLSARLEGSAPSRAVSSRGVHATGRELPRRSCR
jgi:hypothetical protein